MRIAALYDVHGNLPAIEAALRAARRAGADKVLIGGDVAAGPLPVETLEILMALGDWVTAIQGATDRAVVTCYDLVMAKRQSEASAFDPLVRWAAGRITGHQRDWLHALPTDVRFPTQDLGEVHFFHAVPGEGERLRLPPGAAVVVAGRGHHQGTERRDGCLLVYPGSVGMSEDDPPGAYWALLAERVELQRTEYEFAHAARRIGRCGMPGADRFAERYVLGRVPRS